MISLIIPVFNGSEWLAEAIESAIFALKGISHTEIIVVNDGSTDNSLEVAESYKQISMDNIIPYKVINQVNKGLSSARNTGIMNAKYDWILPLDCDDKLDGGCLLRLKKYIIQGLYDIIAPSFKEFGLSDREVILMPNPTLKDFEVGNRIGYCAAIRRDILLEVGGYSPRMTHGYEDLHLWINLLSRGYKITTIPEVLWMYRTKEQSMITEAQKHHLELMAQIKKDFPQWQPTF